MKKNKGFAPIAIVLIIIAVLAVGGVAYYAGKSFKTTPKNVGENNIPQENQSNITTNYSGYGFIFDYPKSWELKDLSELSNYIVVDPQKVLSSSELQGIDVPPGLVAFNDDPTGKNSYVIGYNDFPIVYIGKDKKIQAKKFEKYYPENAPEVSNQGKHIITYLIGESKWIYYYGLYNDSYLNDFNTIIDSLQLQTYQ